MVIKCSSTVEEDVRLKTRCSIEAAMEYCTMEDASRQSVKFEEELKNGQRCKGVKE
jgi:hypothetical protein